MASHHYLIALGSNMRHPRHGSPPAVLRAALEALSDGGMHLEAASPVVASDPLGPSLRRYANAAAIVRTQLEPLSLLACLQSIEAIFGRRSRGMRWRARVLDIDVILWSGGPFASDDLAIPHPEFRLRRFVLDPARTIAANWRDPLSNLTVQQLSTRLTKPRPAPRALPPAPTRGFGALSSVGRATDF